MLYVCPQERISICRYFDAQTGLWLLLPLHWEMDVDFVRQRVKQVMVISCFSLCSLLSDLLLKRFFKPSLIMQ